MSAPKKTYFELAQEAIIALKERSGSSQQAIKSYIVSKYPALPFGQVRRLPCCFIIMCKAFINSNFSQSIF